MVGWSRRARKSSERRERWWNSLSEEEKAKWLANKPARDAREKKLLLICVPAFFLLYLGFILTLSFVTRK